MNATEIVVNRVDGTVSAMSSQVNQNTNDILANKMDIKNIQENPFPNGL
jgi:hypothetical protein